MGGPIGTGPAVPATHHRRNGPDGAAKHARARIAVGPRGTRQEAAVGYRIDVDLANCLTCGICMDVCPVGALDMRRPSRRGVEGEAPNAWLMETPVQVGECIGCNICERECPVSVITVATQATTTLLAGRQGPIGPEVRTGGWIPLSSVTHESLKHDHPSPFAAFASWSTGSGRRPSETWTPVSDARPGGVGGSVAPCQGACPAATDAGRYVGLIAAGRYSEAYAVAAEVNPFPSVCGWICTAPCESVCRRGTLDEPISIRALKRFAVEHGSLPTVTAPPARRAQRVAIVGGGPAGMSAAYYLARLGYPVVVFEAMPIPGGMMALGIPEYRLPRDVLQAEIKRIVDLGVELRLNAAMGRDFSLMDLEAQGFAAVFLATGASRSRRLDVPGDTLEGVVPATVFLKQVNLGEHPRLDGPVAVVGGGSTAMDAARSALRSGASSVTVLYRRGRSDMPAQAEEVDEAEHEGVVILAGVGVTEVVGSDGRLNGARIVDRRPRDNGAAGDWEAVAGSERLLGVSTILVAVGEEPDPSILPAGAGIGVSTVSGIAADPSSLSTARRGVFAGGDVVSGAKTVIDAVAAGRRAAGSIHEFLAGVRDGEAAILAAVRVPRQPEGELTLDIATRSRERMPAPTYVPGSFVAAQAGLDTGAAQREATRCFRCDVIDGCGSVIVLAGRGPDRASSLAPAEAPVRILAGVALGAPPPEPNRAGGWLTAVPISGPSSRREPARRSLNTRGGATR